MQSSAKWWTRTLAAGLIGSALFAGSAFGIEGRVQRTTTTRRVATENPRVVDFKTERTDSWLCINVSPFFCSSIPTVVATPQSDAASSRARGRR